MSFSPSLEFESGIIYEMLQEQELTQGSLRPSRSEQIVFAFSLGELSIKIGDMPFGGPIIIAGIELELLLEKWKGKSGAWGELRRKKVLDIASGSAANSYALLDEKWYPHFARLCAVNGALVTAIDEYPQVGSDVKLLRGIRTNLIPAVVDGKLAELVGIQERYDIIHSAAFVGYNFSPQLLNELRRLKISMEDFRQALFRQSFDLLAEGGIISLEEEDENRELVYYTKKDGKLTQL